MIDKQIYLDLERLKRLKMVEAVWGENKSCDQIAQILRKFKAAKQLALVTRVSEKKASELLEIFEDGETDVNKIKKQENEFLNRIIKKINTKVLS